MHITSDAVEDASKGFLLNTWLLKRKPLPLSNYYQQTMVAAGRIDKVRRRITLMHVLVRQKCCPVGNWPYQLIILCR